VRPRRPEQRGELARYAAPAAFLLAATIAVLLIRSALNESGPAPATTSVAVTTRPTTTAKTTTATTTTTGAARYHTIVSGDTYQQIALDEDTTVDELLRLNPGVDPAALTVGQKVRIR
jgi:LysM repeat protein